METERRILRYNGGFILHAVARIKQEHQQRTLLQMSPVALESDMVVLPALPPPPHCT